MMHASKESWRPEAPPPGEGREVRAFQEAVHAFCLRGFRQLRDGLPAHLILLLADAYQAAQASPDPWSFAAGLRAVKEELCRRNEAFSREWSGYPDEYLRAHEACFDELLVLLEYPIQAFWLKDRLDLSPQEEEYVSRAWKAALSMPPEEEELGLKPFVGTPPSAELLRERDRDQDMRFDEQGRVLPDPPRAAAMPTWRPAVSRRLPLRPPTQPAPAFPPAL